MGNALKFRNSEVPRQAGETARLRAIRGPEAGVTYVLLGNVCVLGRGEKCDIVLMDVKSSRRHAEMRRNPDGSWIIRDQGSSNGIVVAGKVTREGRLTSGAVFSIGESGFEFLTAEAGTQMLIAPPRAAAMSAEELREFERQKQRVRGLGQAAANIPGSAVDPAVDPMSGRKKPSPLLIGAAVVGLAVTGYQGYLETVQKPKTSSVSGLVDKCVRDYVRQDRLKSRIIEGVEAKLKAERSGGAASKQSGAAETTSALATLTLPQIIDKCVADVVSKKRSEKSAKDAERTVRDLAGDALTGLPPEVARVAESLFKQGLREFQNGNFLRARQNFDTVLQMVPSHPLARIYVNHCSIELDNLISRYLAAGRQKLDAGKLREAKGNFDAVKRLLNQDQSNPNFVEADEQAQAIEKMIRKGASG